MLSHTVNLSKYSLVNLTITITFSYYAVEHFSNTLSFARFFGSQEIARLCG